MLALAAPAQAQTATWNGGTTDWNDPTNWTPNAPPFGPTATAIFGGVGSTFVDFTQALTTVETIRFDPGAQQYSINVCACQEVRITGQGVVNLSGSLQEFVNDGILSFRNASSAGNATYTNSFGGALDFRQTATAGTATINNSFGATVSFDNFSTAGSAIIDNSNVGTVEFNGRSTLGSAQLTNTNSLVNFLNQSTAGGPAATIINNNGGLFFYDRSSAGSATIYNNDQSGTIFNNRSSAGNATIINNGGFFGVLWFQDQSTAENATIATKNGSVTEFFDRSTGGQAAFVTEAGGVVDFSQTDGPDNNGKLTAGSIGGDGDYYLGSNQLTVGGNNQSTTVNGTINDGAFCGCAGTGASLVKEGTGTLILSGINTYTGATTVNAGTLIVNGSIALSSLLSVNAGGTVGGSGDLPTTELNGGTLSPGNSVGQINILGNLVVSPTSLYYVELLGATADKVAVTGAATLNGGTVQVALQGAFRFVTPYTIVTTGAGVTGQFGGVTSTVNFVNLALSYVGNDVLLSLTPNLTGAPGLNVNQRSTAGGLDRGLTLAGGTAGLEALFKLTPGALANSLTQLSGELGTASAPAGLESMNQFLSLMLDPFAGSRGDNPNGPALGYAAEQRFGSRNAESAYAAFLPITKAPPPISFESRWAAWGAAYGSHSTADGDAVIGSNQRDVRTGHFAGGVDHRLSPDTVIGLAVSGGSANFKLGNGLGSGSGDIIQGGVYGTTRFDNYYLAASLAASFYDVSTDRIVTVPVTSALSASYNATGFGARIEGGRRFVITGFGVTPFVAVQGETIRTDAYNEQVAAGAPLLALSYAANTTSRLRTELGVGLDHRFGPVLGGSLHLFARIAWAHEYWRDNSILAAFQTLPGSGFTVEGAAPATDAALVSLGADWKLPDGFSLRGKVEAQFAGSVNSYAANAALRKTW
jgi:outer membrane autotransporter protein